MAPFVIEIVEIGTKFVIGAGVGTVVSKAGEELIKKAGLAGAEKLLAKVGTVAISAWVGHEMDKMLNPVFDDIKEWMLPDPEDAAKLKFEVTKEEEKEEETK